jgi:hypothetical protein
MIAEGGGQDSQNESARDLVLRYRVCWEVDTERTYVSHELRTIGFSLQLFGTHEPGTEHISPGCEHCLVVQAGLKKIISSILPQDKRLSRYETTLGSRSLSYSHVRGDRPDVGAKIKILHRGPWDQPVDDCEERCLKEMEQALGELGASKGAWHAN